MDKLLKALPTYYSKSKIVGELFTAEEQEFVSTLNHMADVANQRFIDTATFSLNDWERELGLDIAPNQPYDYRRSRIVSKLRGQGTVTVSLIKNIAESFQNGKVEVIEQPSVYSFTIKFVDTKGVPPNIDDLKTAIEDIKPAHLSFDFVYTYNTWGMISNLTWGAVGGTWETLRTR